MQILFNLVCSFKFLFYLCKINENAGFSLNNGLASDMKDRIKQLMESQHMTQQTFADFLGISSASLSSIFNGRTKPTLNTVEAIRNKFSKISLDWLMYGNGPMFMDQQPSPEGASSSSPQESMKGRTPESPSLFPTSATLQFDGVAQPGKKAYHEELKTIDKPKRQITEIRIFFNDQTWETFVPKK